ncbi:MAG TPA: hypothetical protein VGF94_13775 [Kofleriaceae bacterium]|jgi:hypothetical protein
MRWLPLACAVLATACSKSDSSKPTAGSGEVATAPAPKRPVPKTPLPPLAADPGGATGKPMWSAAFGGVGIDATKAVAIGGDDSVYTVGYFEGESDFGGAVGKRTSAGKSDAFLVKHDSAGKILWAQTFGAAREDVANGVAVHGDTIVAVGNFADELKIGEYDHKASGSDDAFVAAFDPKGQVQWLWTFGGIDSDGANAIAATPDGGWIIGGSYSAALDVGSFHVKAAGGTDALLVKLKPTGDVEWIKSFGGRYDDTILHVACDANGNIYIQGHFKDTADFGGKPLVAAGGSDNDVVLAKYDTNGDHVWSQRFGNAFNDVAGGVAVDPAGNVTMVGSYDKSISFGPGDDHQSLGEADAYIARFTTDGKLVWARTFGAEKEDVAWGVAADDAGNTVTTGWFQGAVDFGKGGTIASKGNKDVFVVKLDQKGAPVWVKTWGDHDHDQGRGVALDSKGNVVVVGIFRFELDVVEPPLESKRDESNPVLAKAPPPDAFVVKLAR